MIRVLVADDQEVVRKGFGMILQTEDDLMVAGEAADGRAAIQAAVEFRPDVVLMDIRMPILDGIAATRAIVECCPDVRVLASPPSTSMSTSWARCARAHQASSSRT